MKLLFVLSLLLLTNHFLILAQPCTKVDFTDKKQQKVLKRFIQECEKKGFLKPDSGLIHLTEWVDKEGQLNWQVWAKLTWKQYTSMGAFNGDCSDCKAPVGWTKVSNRLILRYRTDLPSDTLTYVESSCLMKLIAGSVTVLPPIAPSPKEVPLLDAQGQPVLDKAGRPKMRPFGNTSGGGGGGNNTHITFRKDGSIQKGLSL